MYQDELNRLTNKWENMTLTLLNLEKIPAQKLQRILRETYAALRLFHQRKHVPKELCKLFVEMDAFCYYASLMEDKEVGEGYYYFVQVEQILFALKDGFFSGDYGCEFPQLKVKTPLELDVFNLDSDDLASLKLV